MRLLYFILSAFQLIGWIGIAVYVRSATTNGEPFNTIFYVSFGGIVALVALGSWKERIEARIPPKERREKKRKERVVKMLPPKPPPTVAIPLGKAAAIDAREAAEHLPPVLRRFVETGQANIEAEEQQTR
jgi:hypothetical protein